MEAHPRVEYWASMLLKQVCPQAGKLDSPGTAVVVVLVTFGPV